MYQKFLLFLICMSCLPSWLLAGELKLNLAPVWWQYEELSGKQAGFNSTPLHSVARGYALQVGATSSLEVSPQWYVALGWKGMLPMNQATERWQLGNGVQKNDLQVIQSDFKIALNRQWQDVQTGVFLAYQWHQQSRKQFVKNGLRTVVTGEPIKETVQSTWLGLSVQSGNDMGEVHLEAGLPVWVYTTNDLIRGSFRKRTGFRIQASGEMHLPWQWFDGVETSLTGNYSYRELGGEVLKTLNQTWLWPKNRWQMASLGLAFAW